MFDVIYKNTNSSKIYEINENEKIFFESLFSKLKEKNLLAAPCFIRMSNGTLAFEYGGFPIGKVKLQGKKFFMQIIKSLYKTDEIEGTVQNFIQHQDEWIKYIEKYILKELK